MNQEYLAKHWYAYIYEQQENHTHDIELFRRILKDQLGDSPQRVLEVACGGGRISVPLAQDGHEVVGFDADPHMLLRGAAKGKGLENLRLFQADATTADWGSGYDIVLLAGNLLINLECEMDYKQAQIVMLRKAASALRPGGHLLVDMSLHYDPASVFAQLQDGSGYFEGFDDLGTYGRTYGYGSAYDPVTQICAGASHTEIITGNGSSFVIPRLFHKHIPTQAQLYGWMKDAGLTIEQAYKNHTLEPLPVPIKPGTYNATIWARS